MSRPLEHIALLAVLMLPSAARPADPPIDSLGDPLPPGALFRIGTQRLRHADKVLGIAFAPDGKSFATCGADRVIRLWETATGKELRVFAGHTKGVNAVAFSSDGKTLASAGDDGTARVWDVASGKERLVFRGHGESAVKGVSVAPDGKTIATRGDDAAVRLWDAASGKEMLRIPSGRAYDRCGVAFAPDGKSVAGIAEDLGGVVLWDPRTGKELRRFNPFRVNDTTRVAFTSDGKLLTVGNFDRRVSLWDAETGKHRRDLPADGYNLPAACFEPIGKRLALGEWGGLIILIDVEGTARRHIHGHMDRVGAIAFSPDGKVLVSASDDGRVRLWDPATGKELPQSAPAEVTAAALSRDGKLLATGHFDGTIHFWDAATGKARPTAIAAEPSPVVDVCFAPDGKVVAARREVENGVGLWDVASGKLLRPIRENVEVIFPSNCRFRVAGTVAFSPDGKTLATIDHRRTARLWAAESGKELPHSPLKFEDDPNPTRSPKAERLAFAPDGTLAIAYWLNYQSDVVCWNVADGRIVQRIIIPGGVRISLAFSPDGRCLATADGFGGVVMGHWASGEERIADKPDKRPARTVAFSADGRLLLDGGPDGVVRIAEMYHRTEVKRLSGHRGSVATSAVIGGRLLTVGTDGTAVVWDISRIEPPRRPVKELTAAQLAELWDDLASEEASQAYRALVRAIDAEPQVIDPLRRRLEKVGAVDDKRLAKLLADLDADEFETRENATKELETIGVVVVPELRKVLRGSPSAEVRQRVERLLAKLDGPGALGQQQRSARAVEVLEAVGTPEAIKALEAVAKRPANDDLAQEVKAALERLKKRTTP